MRFWVSTIRRTPRTPTPIWRKPFVTGLKQRPREPDGSPCSSWIRLLYSRQTLLWFPLARFIRLLRRKRSCRRLSRPPSLLQPQHHQRRHLSRSGCRAEFNGSDSHSACTWSWHTSLQASGTFHGGIAMKLSKGLVVLICLFMLPLAGCGYPDTPDAPDGSSGSASNNSDSSSSDDRSNLIDPKCLGKSYTKLARLENGNAQGIEFVYGVLAQKLVERGQFSVTSAKVRSEDNGLVMCEGTFDVDGSVNGNSYSGRLEVVWDSSR